MRKVLFKYRITEEKTSMREQISRLISTTTDVKRFINAERLMHRVGRKSF